MELIRILGGSTSNQRIIGEDHGKIIFVGVTGGQWLFLVPVKGGR